MLSPDYFNRGLYMFDDDIILVNMADYKVAAGPQKLMTRDLGSCVAVCMRDPVKGIGGLLHIMLPKCPEHIKEKELYPKFADSGIDVMVKQLVSMGADRKKLVVKLAGAAHMVKTEGIPESEDLSSRNLAAVKAKLALLNIPIQVMDVEDYYPRTVIYEPATGQMLIKSIGRADKLY